jgi:tetratricopeptide (TPR) repeat protein
MGKTTVKTVPNAVCHEIVEGWILCPQCGTALPDCAPIAVSPDRPVDRCMNCRAVIEKQESLDKSIKTLIVYPRGVRPEARSVRYARLAEAYLKSGDVDSALETYRKAIHFSEFDRKRCNFLVKMANIFHNIGRDKEAMDVLDAALQLDPADIAGANMVRNQINAEGTAIKAREALNAGDEVGALALADEAIRIDPTDYHGASIVKSTILTRKAEKLAKLGSKQDAVKLLDEAVRLDPKGLGPAIATREKLAPKEKKREDKVKRKEERARMKAASKR